MTYSITLSHYHNTELIGSCSNGYFYLRHFTKNESPLDNTTCNASFELNTKGSTQVDKRGQTWVSEWHCINGGARIEKFHSLMPNIASGSYSSAKYTCKQWFTRAGVRSVDKHGNPETWYAVEHSLVEFTYNYVGYVDEPPPLPACNNPRIINEPRCQGGTGMYMDGASSDVKAAYGDYALYSDNTLKFSSGATGFWRKYIPNCSFYGSCFPSRPDNMKCESQYNNPNSYTICLNGFSPSSDSSAPPETSSSSTAVNCDAIPDAPECKHTLCEIFPDLAFCHLELSSSSSEAVPSSSSAGKLSSSSNENIPSSSSVSELSSSSSEGNYSSSSACYPSYDAASAAVEKLRNDCRDKGGYPDFWLEMADYCIYGSRCDMQFGSSSSGGDWWEDDEESEECPSDVPASVSLRGEAYIVDNKAVYAYGDKAYSTSGRYLGVADGVIYSKMPQALAKRDKVAVYADSWNIGSKFYESILRKESNEKKRCGIYGEHYGIMQNGKIIGGVTCSETYTRFEYSTEICTAGSSKIRTDFVSFHTNLIENEIYYVKKGDKIKNSDYIVTKEYETAMYYHELGHKKYNSCLKFPVVKKRICGCYNDTAEINTILRQKIKYEIETKHENMLDSMANLFHSTYGDTGYAKTYKCP